MGSDTTMGMQDPEPHGLTLLAHQVIRAYQLARQYGATEVALEHLLLALIEQGGDVLDILTEWKIDLPALRDHLVRVSGPGMRAKNGPWETIEQRYTLNQIVPGVITRVALFGAFARIADGIEGLVTLPLLSSTTPQMHFQEGQRLHLRIVHIDAERRRLRLAVYQSDLPADAETPLEIRGAEADLEQREGEVAQTSTEDSKSFLSISDEMQDVLLIARRMQSPAMQPVYLFIRILQNKRMQDIFASLTPFPNTFATHPTSTTNFAQHTGGQVEVCPLCKRSTQSHWKHCVYCGQSLTQVCSQCGTPRIGMDGAQFCSECGYQFRE